MQTILLFLFILIALPYSIYLALILFYKKPPALAITDPEPRPEVSIVIPTYNEEAIIGKKLDNVLDLDYPPELLEVVVVDSSTDKTPDIIKGYQKKFQNLRLIQETRKGLASALNTGYALARNEIVIKTDCDSLLEKDVLFRVASDFANTAIGGVTGKQVVINKSRVEESYRSLQSRVQIAESCIDSTIIFHGPFSAYRKNLIVPIDPNSLADDSELAIKIRKQGYRTIIDPEIKFYEASQSAFFKRRMQKDRRGKGLIRLLLRHKDVLFNSEYGNYGKLVFPMNYFMMIFSPYLILLLFSVIFYMLYEYSSMAAASAFILLVFFAYLGQANKLHIFEPLYSFLDTQISLLVGGLSLVFGKESGGTWEVDQELRGAYLKHE
jgi:cellulose synthase/poly-beta-1,6-N-acetylglucosamine synthase-like glycosyltransferase